MKDTAEQIAAIHKANLQALQAFTIQAFAGVEKLVKLNMVASRAAMNEAFIQTRGVLAAKEPKELLALPADLIEPLADSTTAYAEHAQTILTGSGAEFTKAVEAKTAEAQKALGGVLETLSKNAPAGSEAAVAAFNHAMSAGQNALESVQTQARMAVETAQSNFTAAASLASDAVLKATKVS